MTGFAEELALERLAVDELDVAADSAWRSRDYVRALELRRELEEARAHVVVLERLELRFRARAEARS